MTVLETLGIFNYGLVLIYGLFLSTDISGGWDSPQQKRVIFLLCPLFLLIQWLCWLIFGVETATQLYPLIVHLPLALILIFVLKRHFGTALVSVFTAYLCCQLPRWVKLLALAFTASPLAGEVSYALSIIPIFFLLRRFFVQAAHSAMTYSRSSLLLFGSLPFAYYCFDYATTVYSDALNINIHVLTEFLPTALIVFYVVFLAAYHVQTQNRTQAELQQSMLKAELKQSSAELANLRRIETQTAIYQHDMRHHLVVIDGFLSTDSPDLAREYIHKIQSDVESITSKRYCENELVNLLCSSFSAKAARSGVRLDIKARLPNGLSIPDTELCSMMSNALENALNAVAPLDPADRWINFRCSTRMNKLLLETQNPYSGEIVLRDGLPLSRHDGHGYGCASIKSIVEHNGGICVFEPNKGLFTLRIILPMVQTT